MRVQHRNKGFACLGGSNGEGLPEQRPRHDCNGEPVNLDRSRSEEKNRFYYFQDLACQSPSNNDLSKPCGRFDADIERGEGSDYELCELGRQKAAREIIEVSVCDESVDYFPNPSCAHKRKGYTTSSEEKCHVTPRPESNQAENAEKICRICFDSEDSASMIAPCRCSGGQKWIHRTCLNEWRSQDRIPHAFSRCPTCKFEYVTETSQIKPTIKQRIRYFTFVTRDMGLLVCATSLILFLFTVFMAKIDPVPERPLLHTFPSEWAEDRKSVFTFGPYFCCGLIAFLAIVGLVGILLFMMNLDYYSRGNICTGCYYFDAMSLETEVMPCIMICILILAAVGVVVGIGFSVFTMQYILRKHLTILWLQGEAERVVVVDLSKPLPRGGQRK